MSRRNDHRQFEALWREHRALVAKVASMYARQPEDQRDLTQEIAMQLWRSLPRYDATRAKLSTWLYRIALNVAISHLRRIGRSGAPRTEPLDLAHLETLGGGEPIVEPDERLDALYAVVARLDPLDRALMVLYLEDRSQAEIAAVLGISRTNVATKLHRIKHKLREQMSPTVVIGD
jgi:RNA polymerase sigma-70 factor (ECF subfamily)